MNLGQRSLWRSSHETETPKSLTVFARRPFFLWNLFMIGLVMWPPFQQQVKPALSKVLHKWYCAATIPEILGVTAELLGPYIVIVADMNVLRTGYDPWRNVSPG